VLSCIVITCRWLHYVPCLCLLPPRCLCPGSVGLSTCFSCHGLHCFCHALCLVVSRAGLFTCCCSCGSLACLLAVRRCGGHCVLFSCHRCADWLLLPIPGCRARRSCVSLSHAAPLPGFLGSPSAAAQAAPLSSPLPPPLRAFVSCLALACGWGVWCAVPDLCGAVGCDCATLALCLIFCVQTCVVPLPSGVCCAGALLVGLHRLCRALIPPLSSGTWPM
jgi:hypothetical protein